VKRSLSPTTLPRENRATTTRLPFLHPTIISLPRSAKWLAMWDPGIKQGKGKRIEWESKAELAKYKGPLTFEIEVKVIAPFALKTSLTAARRGKSLPLKWRGGDQDQTVRIELLKAGVVEGTLGTIENKGFYEWNVAAKQRPGKDYSLRLVNGKETVNSQRFAIKCRFG